MLPPPIYIHLSLKVNVINYRKKKKLYNFFPLVYFYFYLTFPFEMSQNGGGGGGEVSGRESTDLTFQKKIQELQVREDGKEKSSTNFFFPSILQFI